MLTELTTRIVSAYVSNNSVSAADIPDVITSVYGAIRDAGTATEQPAEKAEPAVSVRSSVKPDYIVCLDCGRRAKMLKRHIAVEHNLTPEAYRAKWGLPQAYPMVAPSYSTTRSTLAKTAGLGRRTRTEPELPVEASPKPRRGRPPSKPQPQTDAGPPAPSKPGRGRRRTGSPA